jgi:hypothetical protein
LVESNWVGAGRTSDSSSTATTMIDTRDHRPIVAPPDPMGKCFFNILATLAEFEVDLLRMRTREGWRWPKPTVGSRANLQAQSHPGGGPLQAPRGWRSHDRRAGELFSVSRATVYREIARAEPKS